MARATKGKRSPIRAAWDERGAPGTIPAHL